MITTARLLTAAATAGTGYVPWEVMLGRSQAAIPARAGVTVLPTARVPAAAASGQPGRVTPRAISRVEGARAHG